MDFIYYVCAGFVLGGMLCVLIVAIFTVLLDTQLDTNGAFRDLTERVIELERRQK